MNKHTIVEIKRHKDSSEEELVRVMKEAMEESYNCTVMEMEVGLDEITAKVRCNQTGRYYTMNGKRTKRV